jgi:hypothetical protein
LDVIGRVAETARSWSTVLTKEGERLKEHLEEACRVKGI